MANEIKKVLAAQQDLLYGEGKDIQQRAGVDVEVDKVRAGYYPCGSAEEMAELDPERFPRASLVVGGKLKFYVYDGTKYLYVAVEGTDLEGKDTAVDFLDGSAYMQIASALPGPSVDNDLVTMTMTVKLKIKAGTRYIVGEGDNQTIYASAAIRDNLFVITDATGVEQTADITSLAIPFNEFIVITVDSQLVSGQYSHRLGYNGNYSNWITDNSVSGKWLKFFGHGIIETGVFGAVQTIEYVDSAALNYKWNFANQEGRTVYCNIYGYNGSILGNAYEVSDPLFSDALAVTFDPAGTAYPPSASNVDATLRNIDKVFQRKATGDPSVPTPPDDTPLESYEIWLADTNAPTSRPLIANPLDGDEITVRDDVGLAGTNSITIGRAGKTIMGLEADMTIESNWSWVRLKYFSGLDDWRVIGGGVGGQVKIIPDDIANALYPVGHVILSKNANDPASYLQFGVWVRGAVGTVLAGIGQRSDINGLVKDVVQADMEGEWSHSQTEAELAVHQHAGGGLGENATTGAQMPFGWDTQYGTNNTGAATATDNDNVMFLTDKRGTGALANITNPMTGYYVWERIA